MQEKFRSAYLRFVSIMLSIYLLLRVIRCAAKKDPWPTRIGTALLVGLLWTLWVWTYIEYVLFAYGATGIAAWLTWKVARAFYDPIVRAKMSEVSRLRLANDRLEQGEPQEAFGG